MRADGRGFVVIYDHPVLGEQRTVRIVSKWTLREAANHGEPVGRSYP